MNKTYGNSSYNDCFWIPIWHAVTVTVVSWKWVSAVDSAKHFIYIMDSISSNSLILPGNNCASISTSILSGWTTQPMSWVLWNKKYLLWHQKTLSVNLSMWGLTCSFSSPLLVSSAYNQVSFDKTNLWAVLTIIPRIREKKQTNKLY